MLCSSCEPPWAFGLGKARQKMRGGGRSAPCSVGPPPLSHMCPPQGRRLKEQQEVAAAVIQRCYRKYKQVQWKQEYLGGGGGVALSKVRSINCPPQTPLVLSPPSCTACWLTLLPPPPPPRSVLQANVDCIEGTIRECFMAGRSGVGWGWGGERTVCLQARYLVAVGRGEGVGGKRASASWLDSIALNGSRGCSHGWAIWGGGKWVTWWDEQGLPQPFPSLAFMVLVGKRWR